MAAALTGVLLDDGSHIVTGAQIKRVTEGSDGTVTRQIRIAECYRGSTTTEEVP